MQGNRIVDELHKGLKFVEPDALLHTRGADWDYCNDERSTSSVKLREAVQKLKDYKGKGPDKKLHPIILALAGPGEGKSRFLTELPRTVKNMQILQGRCFAFLLTLENGTKFNSEVDQGHGRMLAGRMLWQLVKQNRQTGWGGLPLGFTFEQLMGALPQNFRPDDVFQALTIAEGSDWHCILAVDGLQEVPGAGTDKTSKLYQAMQYVCGFVNRDEDPLVIGAVGATTPKPVQETIADSPQDRVFIDLPPVSSVTRGGCQVFNTVEDLLLGLLVQDMGGHGRALEALEEATQSQHSTPEEFLVVVKQKLCSLYPDILPADFEPFLKLSLVGKWLKVGEKINGKDPEQLRLVKLHYDDTRTMLRIEIPYIWIYVGLSRPGTDRGSMKWQLNDYTQDDVAVFKKSQYGFSLLPFVLACCHQSVRRCFAFGFEACLISDAMSGHSSAQLH